MVHPSSSPAELADQLAERRIDVALIGLCGRARPPREQQLAWHDIAVDTVCVLLPADHPLAGHAEAELSEFADATWAAGGPYECCFEECFAAACARAGFTMRRMYEVDARTATELVEAGEAVALCQSSFRPPDGLVSVPIAGRPLQWRHVIGWVPGVLNTDAADQLLDFARRSYDDVLIRRR
jgi:DNA-binding transcriptional LysR family regulator